MTPLHNGGARPDKVIVSLGLCVCVLLGALLIVDGARVARREALEHLSLSGGSSMMDRPSHRSSSMLLIGVLSAVVSLRAIFHSGGGSLSMRRVSLTITGDSLGFRDFLGSTPQSRAPPSWLVL